MPEETPVSTRTCMVVCSPRRRMHTCACRHSLGGALATLAAYDFLTKTPAGRTIDSLRQVRVRMC